MRLQPLFARIILQREKLATTLIIPDVAQRRNAPSKGRVIAVGPMAEPEIQSLVGKTVLFGQHAGAWINEDGTPSGKDEEADYFVCNEEDLIAVIDGAPVRKAA